MTDYRCGRRSPRTGAQCSKFWTNEHLEHHALETDERWTDEEAERVREERKQGRQKKAEVIWDLVIADMRERDAIGLERYGKRLTSETPIDSLRYAYEELLDGACYLRKLLYERDGK